MSWKHLRTVVPGERPESRREPAVCNSRSTLHPTPLHFSITTKSVSRYRGQEHCLHPKLQSTKRFIKWYNAWNEKRRYAPTLLPSSHCFYCDSRDGKERPLQGIQPCLMWEASAQQPQKVVPPVLLTDPRDKGFTSSSSRLPLRCEHHWLSFYGLKSVSS